MTQTLAIVNFALLVPLAALITYYDVRYRRIPNAFVLAALVGGVSAHAALGGLGGLGTSLGGLAVGFGIMFVLHVFGAMGAGDVKLFAAVGSMVGSGFVLQTFAVVACVGGLLAVYTMLRAGSARETMFRVLRIFVGLLPGWEMPRFAVPADRRHTIPYGVAITFGSLVSVFLFRA
ncbi:MAG TPA: A24 family peptidase [Pyrinomonadaceae bacterium]|nr:A24 family peptidase [Pyrinomonadaceae bacterium]